MSFTRFLVTAIALAATLTVNGVSCARTRRIPPSITSQPASQSATVGQTATFSVAASGSSPLRYQWRKNGMDILGATFSTYTTSPATMQDSGAQFTVVVSNRAGSTTSNAATITVTPSGTPGTSVTPSSPELRQSRYWYDKRTADGCAAELGIQQSDCQRYLR